MEQLASLVPAGIFTVDAEGRITYFNARAVEIWGAAPQRGQSYLEFTAAQPTLTAPIGHRQSTLRPMESALREGRSFHQQQGVFQRPNGTQFTATFSIDPTRDELGLVNGAIAVFEDITAERVAEAVRHETEERYRAVFQQASVGIMECDLQGRIVRTNPALRRLVGYSDEELLRMNWRALVPPEELGPDIGAADTLKRGEIESFSAERRFMRKDGSYGWIDVFATLIRAQGDQPSHGLAVVVDITKRKRAEAQLRETEARFRMAADHAPVLIWIGDPAQRCTWVNEPWLTFVGRPLTQELGTGWLENMHAEDRERFARVVGSAYANREWFSVEFRLRRHDGEYRWMLNHGVPRFEGSEFVGYIGSSVDITDRRQAEEAIHESRNAERARRQELEVLNQVAPAAVWIAHDRECRHVTRNAAADALLRPRPGGGGKGEGDANVPRVQVYCRGELVPEDGFLLRRAARTGDSVLHQELEFRAADGRSTWVYGSATPLRDEQGAPRGAICVLVDITIRRLAEAALRHSEEQLRLVTDHASVFIAQVDRDLRYRFVNRAYAEPYGRQPSDLVGRHVAELAGAEAFNTAREHMARALAGERVEFEMEIPILGREKSWGSIVFEPERDNRGEVVGFVAVLVDITARKQAELQLERARDEALAASRAKDDFLAALSHELRTPLSPVLLLASEAAGDPKLPASVRQDFEMIRKSVELEARLIDDLLDLTRIVRNKVVLDRRPVDVPVVLRDALITVHAELRAKNIALILDLAPEPHWVSGDPVRLQQVFWNVLKNAAKFTPDRGRVTITTRTDALRGLIIIEVEDTGIGMTPAEIEHVFEAFAQGEHAAHGGSHRFGGLGLGLAITQRVVELHGGTISARSVGRDHGAVFRIELPRLPVAAQPPAEEAPPQTILPRQPLQARRILLVEDHGPTRAALESLLARRNYLVRSAATVAEARALAAREKFDLLISDIGLPDGTGHDLMQELAAQHGLRGIALTGYGMDEDVARSQSAGFLLHLTKPVRIQNLDAALAQVAFPSGAPVRDG